MKKGCLKFLVHLYSFIKLTNLQEEYQGTS